MTVILWIDMMVQGLTVCGKKYVNHMSQCLQKDNDEG